MRKMSEEPKDTEWYRRKFLYPNGTLKNKLNIKDAAKKKKKEYLGSAVRALAFLRKNKRLLALKI